jgi:Susd and RagB outer membrane lipoprotein
MKKILYLISVSIFFLSCTKDFEEINTNPVAIAEVTPTEFPFLFSTALEKATFGSEEYQVCQSLFADQYAQYFANTTTYFNSDRFVMRMEWLRNIWRATYVRTAPQLQAIMKGSDPNSPEYAMASVWWVFTFHRLTDYIGPIPYFNVGKKLESVPYDAQDKIYDDFLKRLAAASVVLKANSTKNVFGSYDILFGGSVAKWSNFCNSLRLRLALRISKVDPARAKAEAEAAVAAGVFLNSPADDALLKRSNDYGLSNGLSLQTTWGEFRMSASMESVLKGYQDPRISEYFTPTANSGTDFRGIRNGLTANQIANNAANQNDNLSLPGFRWDENANAANCYSTPQNVMSTAEAYFLRAEGALNGWNMGGTAKELYESGITNSMKQWGITDAVAIANYINSVATPVALSDFLNSPALTNIPVKFGAGESVQREQIGTQKWLAIYPDGFEGWAEYRRTRFPKLYPVPNSDNPDINPGAVIRRIPFLDADKQTNQAAVTAAEALLSGPDKVTTPLWWDKN